MDPNRALKEFAEGVFRPVYAVYGADRFRARGFVEALTAKLLPEDEREFGVARFDTAESPVEEAVLEAEEVPFFASRKLVIVRDASVLAAGGKEGGKISHNTDLLSAYLKMPSDASILVFLVHADKLDERRKVVKQLKDMDALVAFQELDAPELARWAVRRAADQGRTLEEGAARLLVERTGSSMQRLAQETDKVCLYAGEGGTVKRMDVEALTVSSTEEDIFVMIDAMSSRNLGKAVSLYRELLLRREEPIKIAALLARQFRIMLQIKELESHSYSQQQMASQLGLHPYAVKLAAEKARSWRPAQLGRQLDRLAELDYRMKTGQTDKVLGLELFLLSLGA